MTSTSVPSSNHLLFDIPVSNNGGRARIIVYKKGIPESDCSVVSPAELGGFKSKEYLAINPQGKVPALKCQSTGLCLAESDTVCRYLLTAYAHVGPSFQPDNPLSNKIARFHDMYLTTIQSCLYRAAPPFGSFGIRKDALREYCKQLYFIAELIDATGPYLCGKNISLADATVFPSIVFASFMFPKFEEGIMEQQAIPPMIQEWYQRMIDTDAAFQKVYEEVSVLHTGRMFCESLDLIDYHSFYTDDKDDWRAEHMGG
jgi:glutathione S-transferase